MKKSLAKVTALSLVAVFGTSTASASEQGPISELSALACEKIIGPAVSSTEFVKDLSLAVDIPKACACAAEQVSQDPRLVSYNAGSRDNLKAKMQDKRFSGYLFTRTMQASFACGASELDIALDKVSPRNGTFGGD